MLDRCVPSFPTRRSSDLQWTFKLALSNTFIHLVSLFVLIVIVNNPHLFHPEFVPYMADLVDKPFDSVIITVNWIKWAIIDRKSTRLNSSHVAISYAVFCL